MVEAGFLVVTINTRGIAVGFDAVRDSLHFAEVSKEKTKGRFFDQSAQYMTRQ